MQNITSEQIPMKMYCELYDFCAMLYTLMVVPSLINLFHAASHKKTLYKILIEYRVQFIYEHLLLATFIVEWAFFSHGPVEARFIFLAIKKRNQITCFHMKKKTISISIAKKKASIFMLAWTLTVHVCSQNL